jgi:hypothetical protein
MHGASPAPFKQLFEHPRGAAPERHIVLVLDQSPRVRAQSIGLAPLTRGSPADLLHASLLPMWVFLCFVQHQLSPSVMSMFFDPIPPLPQAGGGHFSAAVPEGAPVSAVEAQHRVAEPLEELPPGASAMRAGGSPGGRRGAQERAALAGTQAVKEVRWG